MEMSVHLQASAEPGTCPKAKVRHTVSPVPAAWEKYASQREEGVGVNIS